MPFYPPGGGLSVATTRLSSAQLTSLHASPATIVPAQPGRIILPVQFAAVYNPLTTPYTSTASSIFIIWSGDSGGNFALSGFVANWSSFTGAANFDLGNITGFTPLMGATIPLAQVVGASLQVKNFGTDLSAGDGSLDITTVYALK